MGKKKFILVLFRETPFGVPEEHFFVQSVEFVPRQREPQRIQSCPDLMEPACGRDRFHETQGFSAFHGAEKRNCLLAGEMPFFPRTGKRITPETWT